MTVPSRTAAAALLVSLDPPPWGLRHARAVAEVAAWLAFRVAQRGGTVERGLVEAAALLHDADKLLPPDHPFRRLHHGDGSAAWLTEHGHRELASAVDGHPVTRLADDDWYVRWAAGASLEARIVAYADKRAGQRLEPMAERFRSWDRRYPRSWDAATLDAVHRRADALEREVCDAAGVHPEAVRRLRWTGPALAAAAAATSSHPAARRGREGAA